MEIDKDITSVSLLAVSDLYFQHVVTTGLEMSQNRKRKPQCFLGMAKVINSTGVFPPEQVKMNDD